MPLLSLAAPLSTALTLALLVAGWLTLAPAQFGGRVTYVVVAGNSMEPSLHTGDLTIVRRADEYTTGDVVAYRHPDVGTIIHRIVERDGERFVLKGDHNTWLDSHRPEAAEVLGRLWLHVPGAGRLLQAMRAPWVLAVFGGLVGIMAVGSGSVGKKPLRGVVSVSRGLDRRRQGWVAAGVGAVVVSATLAAVAHRAPLERVALRDVTYEHSGAFAYAAPAAPGSRAYDGAGAATGDPIFRRVASTVNVSFAYDLRTAGELDLSDVGGHYRVTAVVSDTNGWKRTLELAPLTPFSGGSVTAEATLALGQLQALLDAVHGETGVEREVYQVAIVPELQLQGTLAGQPITPAGGRFAPALAFRLEPLQLQPISPPGFEGDPLRPAQRGLVKAPRVEPNGLPLLRVTLPMALARTLSLGALALSVAATGAVVVLAWRAGARGEAARIAAQYGTIIAEVVGAERPAATRVRVVSFEDLVRIAEREGRTILHHTGGMDDAYEVPAGELTYRYVARREDGADDPGTGGAILRLVPRSSPEPVAIVARSEPRFVPLRLERAV